jgi:hypothetical protein
MKHLKPLAFPLLLLLILLIAITCKKEEENKIEGTDLYGKWEWVSSTGGAYGKTLTPVTEGYALSMEFKETRLVEFRQNNAVTSEKAFSIVHDAKVSSLPIIKLVDDLTWMYTIKGDSLFLDDVCSTCYDHKYVKVK